VTDRDGQDTGIVMEAFAVPGKVPLYREDAAAGENFGTEPGDSVGLAITAGEQACFYIPGCAVLTADVADRLRGAPLVLFDGTLWRDDEMVVAGVGRKTGRRMGHISIDGDAGSLAGFAGLGVRRKIFVHINNTNPILLADSAERAAVERAGWEVAHDGMVLVP